MQKKLLKKYLLLPLMVGLVALPTACDQTGFDDFLDGDPVDRKLKLSRADYRDFYDEKKTGAKDNKETQAQDLPLDLASVLAAPRPPKIGETKLVSLAVTDDVPLKDVLIELAKLADIDLEMDSNIKGGISFRAKDRPFNEVIERVSSLAGLRYEYTGGVLRIERDLPFIENYPLDFLNLVRSSNSNVNITTDILAISNAAAAGGAAAGGGGAAGGGAAGGGGGGGGAAGGGGGGGGVTTGSSTSIQTQAKDDFWQSLESNIRSILTHKSPKFLSGAEDETVNPDSVAAQAAATPAAAAGGGGAAGGVTTNIIGDNMFYVLNRQAGLLSIAASERQHESIRRYLEHVRRGATSQVLIEAKVVEVELEERFKSGIDWNLFQQELGGGNWNVTSSYGQNGFDTANLVRLALNPNDPTANINSVLNLTELFGTTRTLSSPRLHAINNQPAVLTFAQNKVFFEVQLTQQPDTVNPSGQIQRGQISIATNRNSIPLGIILNILPSVNVDSNEITLSVRPTLTRQVGEVVDPGSAFASSILISDPANRIVNTVPIVEVRELDSIMRLKSGQVMVIGGLMEQSNVNKDNGVPFLSGVPFLGNAFKGVDKQSRNKELIIFIKASIVSPEGNTHEIDKKVYHKYTDDPRPIAF